MKAICVDNTNCVGRLAAGQTYNVEPNGGSFDVLCDDGVLRTYYQSRFRVVTEVPPEPKATGWTVHAAVKLLVSKGWTVRDFETALEVLGVKE